MTGPEPEPKPVRTYNRRPVMKIWPIPARGQRTLSLGRSQVLCKFCDHCHLPKPIADYRLDAAKEDGLYGTCRACESGRRRYLRAVEDGVIPPQPNRTWGEDFPIIVCLCGSTRFVEDLRSANLEETLQGRIVLAPGAMVGSDDETFGHLPMEELGILKASLDELHKRKIDLADEILVVNPGGYIGPSTQSEVEYAMALGKPIRYMYDNG